MIGTEVFISYSSEDKNMAHLVSDAVKSVGISTWIAPESIPAGARYASAIMKGLDECGLVLLIYSKHCNKSEHVANEIDKAVRSDKTIIPFCLDDSKMSEELDYYLSRKQHIIAYPNPEEVFDKLIRQIATALDLDLDNNIMKEQNEEIVTNQALYSLKVKPNADCEVLIDDEERGLAKANKITKFPLEKGEYALTCVSKESNERVEMEDVVITDCDVLRKPMFDVSNDSDEAECPLASEPNINECQPEEYHPSFDDDKSYLKIGLLGHVDHGKTTLVAAISSFLSNCQDEKKSFEEIDDAPLEVTHGVKYNKERVDGETVEHHYSFYDYPGFEDSKKAMTASPDRLNGAILVVSAQDGPMPQTREHLLIARMMHIPNIVVFINKCDMVDDEEMLDLVKEEMCDLLVQYGYDGDDDHIIFGSALGALRGVSGWTDKVEELMEACDWYFDDPIPNNEKPFLMTLTDAFPVEGRGIVARGHISTGFVRPNYEVELLGYGKKKIVAVDGIEMFGKVVDEGEAGDDAGLILPKVKTDYILPGMVACDQEKFEQHKQFKAYVYINKSDEGGVAAPLKSGQSLQFFLNSCCMTGKIKLPHDVVALNPGDTCEISITLVQPLVLLEGTQFVMNEAGKMIGVGVITEVNNA